MTQFERSKCKVIKKKIQFVFIAAEKRAHVAL